jgi:phage tail sheath protein FI
MPNYLSPGVYVEEVQAGSRPIEGVGTAVAAFVGIAAQGPFNEPRLVTNWSQFVSTFGDFIEGSYLAHAVYGYFLNGGGACYVVRIGADETQPTARADLPSASEKGKPAFRLAALEPGAAGNEISVTVAEASEPGEGMFKLVVSKGGKPAEEFDNLTVGRGKQNVATVLKAQSKLLTVEEVGALTAPAVGTSVTLSGGAAVVSARLSPQDYVGSASDRTGFAGLEAIEEITMLAIPDLMAAYERGVLELDGVLAVQRGMIAHCEAMGDRMAILDPPPGLNAQQIKEWRTDRAAFDSKYAVLYWPWIRVFDPLAGGTRFVPPSGHLAGIWARSDDTRGVHKAPANEIVRGALGVELQLTRSEHDQLNPANINAIRAFPGRGIRVWGARTLSSDPAWRYINVRRLFNYMEESILQGTQWVVFEPNDVNLWERVKRTVSAFLTGLWRDGALFGRTPQEAFYVKCDAETNPPDVIDRGQLVIEVGVAPVKPAEFVIFRIAQFSGGAAVNE